MELRTLAIGLFGLLCVIAGIWVMRRAIRQTKDDIKEERFGWMTAEVFVLGFILFGAGIVMFTRMWV